jgi:hypothetical protein
VLVLWGVGGGGGGARATPTEAHHTQIKLSRQILFVSRMKDYRTRTLVIRGGAHRMLIQRHLSRTLLPRPYSYRSVCVIVLTCIVSWCVCVGMWGASDDSFQ